MVDCCPVYVNLPCKNDRLYLPGDTNVFIERVSANFRLASAINTTFLKWLIFLECVSNFHGKTKAGVFQATRMCSSSERA
jgi:hypothetical protein